MVLSNVWLDDQLINWYASLLQERPQSYANRSEDNLAPDKDGLRIITIFVVSVYNVGIHSVTPEALIQPN